MNLVCDGLNLLQTPTHITDMCMMNKKGEVRWIVKGSQAKRTMYMYMIYAKSTLYGVWHDAESLKERRLEIDEHIGTIKRFIKERGNSLEVYKV